MSKSYKLPYCKDKTGHKWYNKKFRRINKQRINFNLSPKLMKELINDYDVCDYKSYCKSIKYTRK